MPEYKFNREIAGLDGWNLSSAASTGWEFVDPVPSAKTSGIELCTSTGSTRRGHVESLLAADNVRAYLVSPSTGRPLMVSLRSFADRNCRDRFLLAVDDEGVRSRRSAKGMAEW